ncbi:unnamed protein product, partial [Mesorhabditis spiculigera]
MTEDANVEIDLKQVLPAVTYLAPLIAFAIFFGVVFLLSITFINWFCVRDVDDITALEEWGYKANIPLRLGPHRRSVVGRNIGRHRLAVATE